jgi:3-keto-5-aminohexanoate cleavage enzyme
MERTRVGLGPLIITCALNGGVQGKEVNSSIPETPDEIAAQASEAYNAGASIVHIHGRRPSNHGEADLDPDVMREINTKVRARCPDLLINNTTGGGPTTQMEQRFATLDAGADLASLNMGPDMSRFRIPERRTPLDSPHGAQEFDICIPFTYGLIEELAAAMLNRGIKPEMETYHTGQFWTTRALLGKGLIKKPYMHQLVMGYQTSALPTFDNVLSMLREMPEPEDSVFFVAAIGQYQLPLTTFSIMVGGHVRIGLEDNVYYRRGEKATGNGQLIDRTVRIARELNREVASPAEARAILGLQPVGRAGQVQSPS